MSPASVEGQRLHALDALRAIAMLLGIALHASLAYIPLPQPWATSDRSHSDGLAVLIFLLHSCRMPAFFLMAGFFARLAYRRRGGRAFLRDRLWRIVLPLVVAWLVVFPSIVLTWVAGAKQMGSALIPPMYRQYSSLEIANGVLTDWQEIRKAFSLGHLWFLYYLLLIYLLFFATRALLRHGETGLLAGRWMDAMAHRVALSAGGTAAVMLAIGVLLQWSGTNDGIQIPEHTLMPDPSGLLVYFLFFALGWALHRAPGLLEPLGARPLRSALAFSVTGLILLGSAEWSKTHPHPLLERLWLFGYAAIMWWGMTALLGCCLRWFRHPSAAWRYLADASYWLYLVHLPLVTGLQVALYPLPWNWAAKFAVVLAGTTALSLAGYALLVRSTVIGAALNGRRYPRWSAAVVERAQVPLAALGDQR